MPNLYPITQIRVQFFRQKWYSSDLISLIEIRLKGRHSDHGGIICNYWRPHPHSLRPRLTHCYRESNRSRLICLKVKAQADFVFAVASVMREEKWTRSLPMPYSFYYSSAGRTPLFDLFASQTNFKSDLWKLQWLSWFTNSYPSRDLLEYLSIPRLANLTWKWMWVRSADLCESYAHLCKGYFSKPAVK